MSNGAQAIVDVARTYLGVDEGTPEHHAMMDYYNANTSGYDMGYWDAWCAAGVSVWSLKAGTAEYTGTSVNCDEFRNIWRNKGIYRGGNAVPAMGWLINYDWDGNGSDDHIGLVVDCDGSTIQVIECNKADSVGYRWIDVGDPCISCFGAPNYGDSSYQPVNESSVDQLALEVLAGVHGNGDARKASLGVMYQAVQARVNQMLGSGTGSSPSPVNAGGSSSIREVQSWINANYGAGVEEDGIFGPETRGGLVYSLQSELNGLYGADLATDRCFGPITKSKCPCLSRYVRGDLVKILQGALICLGYNTGGFDGIYGDITYGSVRDYQARRGLEVDGIAGPNTLESLLR